MVTTANVDYVVDSVWNKDRQIVVSSLGDDCTQTNLKTAFQWYIPILDVYKESGNVETNVGDLLKQSARDVKDIVHETDTQITFRLNRCRSRKYLWSYLWKKWNEEHMAALMRMKIENDDFESRYSKFDMKHNAFTAIYIVPSL